MNPGDDEVMKKFKAMADPITADTEAGIAFHNMYSLWVAGGFTEDQALTLLAKWMVEHQKAQGENDAGAS